MRVSDSQRGEQIEHSELAFSEIELLEEANNKLDRKTSY